MNATEYAEAKKYLREHFKACNCFLPAVSCTLVVERLKLEAGDYWFSLPRSS